MEFKEANLLYRVRKTVLQMLKDRGYVVSEKKLKETLDEFEKGKDGKAGSGYNGQRESLNMLYSKKRQEGESDDSVEKILVFFPDNDKLGTDGLNNIAVAMLKNNVTNAIVVIKGTTQITRRVS
jgi:DNA-directed RNA polymerase I, II, and III subunit RPABC1